MPNFYLRIKSELNGTNIVHKKGCPFMPDIQNRIPLGEFKCYKMAAKEAGRYFSRITGCYFCIKECYEPCGPGGRASGSDIFINKQNRTL